MTKKKKKPSQSVQPTTSFTTQDDSASALQKSRAVTPGYLLSNIPGSLGFFPRESLVLMGFEQEESKLILGPIARLDLGNLQWQCEEAFSAVAANNDVVLAFVISQRPPAELNSLADFLFDFCSADDCGIDACWYAAEITVGQPYELWFGPDFHGLEPFPAWQEGTIPVITEALSMQPWFEQGKLPEITRDDVLNNLNQKNPFVTGAQARTLTAIAKQHAENLIKDKDTVPQDVPTETTALLEKAGAAHLRETVEALLRKERTVNDIYHDPKLLTVVASWLSHTTVRDVVIGPLLQEPGATENLMLAVMHTFSGTVRANALSIYAATQVIQELSMIAGIALLVATQEQPEHRLASLMNQAYRAGLHAQLVENLCKGSEVAYRNWKQQCTQPPTAGGVTEAA